MVWRHDAPDNTLIMSHNAVDCWFVRSLDDIVILTRQHWKAMWACDARAPAKKCYNLLENSELELSFSLRGNNQLKLSFSLRGLLKQRVPTRELERTNSRQEEAEERGGRRRKYELRYKLMVPLPNRHSGLAQCLNGKREFAWEFGPDKILLRTVFCRKTLLERQEVFADFTSSQTVPERKNISKFEIWNFWYQILFFFGISDYW